MNTPVGNHTRKILISKVCPFCYKEQRLLLEGDDQVEGYKRWLGGERIQRALPILSPSDRELLMTGICEDCFRMTELLTDE